MEKKKVIPVECAFKIPGTRPATDEDERFVLIRFVHNIRLWHLWMMGLGGSYSLQEYKSKKSLLDAFKSGDIHKLWKGCFEDPMPYDVAVAHDNEE